LRAHILNASAGGPTPGRSRWFDKSINMSVERDGRASVNGEHSPCEALIPAIAVDYALAEPTPPSLLLHAPRGTQGNAWARLRWKTDERIHKAIAEAERMSDAAVADSDAAMLWADEYGTDFIKAVGAKE
jgi:carnitine O-acetyltransferase